MTIREFPVFFEFIIRSSWVALLMDCDIAQGVYKIKNCHDPFLGFIIQDTDLMPAVFQGEPRGRIEMGALILENHGEVMVVRLNRGVTNPIDPEFVGELTEVIDHVEKNQDVRAMVLAANEKFFSMGFDIPRLFGLGPEEFKSFFHAFNRACLNLYVLPKPTVAALTGHAIAGGCILALCCDYRLIAAGRRLMGLNEIKLGVPVPYLADASLRSLVGGRHAREIMETGGFYDAESAAKIGMVDEICPIEAVLDKAIEKARLLGSMPEAAFGRIKRNRVAAVEAEVKEKEEEQERYFLECWYSETARNRLKEAMEKFR
jgi:enoyl-CoA hydratase/carnithine racemase